MDPEKPTPTGASNIPSSTLTIGEKVGPYQIAGILGAGGMGMVYRALDSRLGRYVALKFLSDSYASGTTALERFQREARAISTLNHPHVCTIYDIGQDHHGPFLVMELLEGQTLKQRIAAGRCSNKELISIGLQISDALEAAHSHGLVHRDIKPANVFITTNGLVKVLDFGLAKSIYRAGAGADPLALQDLPTQAETLTKSDVTLGTVTYMSPEQARGEDVDARTDLFSFGVVLYEMASGVVPFPGETSAVTFDGILNRPPRRIRDLNPDVLPDVERIIEKALEKDRTVRYQTASDMNADLRRARRAMEPSAMPAPAAAGNRRFMMIALLAIILAGAAAVFYRPRTPATSPSEYVQITNFPDSATAPSLSPDGRMVSFIRGGEPFLSRGQIYVKLLPDGESRKLTDDPALKYGPVFTPDGSRIAYTRLVQTAGSVSWDTWTVPVLGGEPTPFLPNASGLVWTSNRAVMFSKIMGTGLHMGIVASTETRSDEREIYYPSHERAMAHYSYSSPDQKSVLLVEMDRTAAWQPCRLVPFGGGTMGRQVGPGGACTSAAWSPDGRWMYFGAYVDGASHLWRQKVPDGTPEQITFGPTEEEGITLAPDGKSLITSLGVRRREIWIHDSSGDRRISSEGFPSMPTMAANGKGVYYLLRQGSASSPNELHSLDLESGKTENLLPGLAIEDYAISADGKEVAFTARGGNRRSEIWVASLDRRTPPRKVYESGDQVSFGAEGSLLFRMLDEKANYLGRTNKDGSDPRRVTDVPILNKYNVSPGGDWVSALVAGSGDNVSAETVAIPVSGGKPRLICGFVCVAGWAPDGRYFYATVENGGPDAQIGKIAVLPIARGATLPDLPATGLPARLLPALPNTRQINLTNLSPGPAVANYVYSRTDIQRNLFRIPLH